VYCSGNLKGGVYCFNNGKLQYLRKGFEINDIRKKDEFILTEGVPTPEMKIKRNKKILKLIFNSSISAEKATKLNKKTRRIVATVYKELKIKRYGEK